jgi:hypothetical protein
VEDVRLEKSRDDQRSGNANNEGNFKIAHREF